MKARVGHIIAALTVLPASAAVWLDWRAVAFTLCAYGLHCARPIIMDWFDA